MPNVSDFLNKLIELKKTFVKNLSKVGVTASNAEKYNSLIEKVKNISVDLNQPFLKGEEIVLNNELPTKQKTQVFEYPETENLAKRYKKSDSTIINGIACVINSDESLTAIGTSGEDGAFIPFAYGQEDFFANEVYCWDFDIPQEENVYYCFSGSFLYDDELGNITTDNLPQTGTIMFSEIGENCKLGLKVEPNTFINITVNKPIFYKQKEISVKVESKNLFAVKNITQGYSRDWSGQTDGATFSGENDTITWTQSFGSFKIYKDFCYPPGTYTVSSTTTSGSFSRPYIMLSKDGNPHGGEYLDDSDITIEGLTYNSFVEG